MSDTEPQKQEPVAQATYRARPLRIIWLLPVIALGIAAWFLVGSLRARGPEITVRFETADGLEAGKTPIKHKDVVLGTVVGLKPVDGFKHVEVTARMNHLSEEYLNKDTQFWIVRPRVSVQEITGLNTLLSGAYVEMTPGGGEQTDHFTGLEQPPAISPDAKGKSFTLLTDDLGTLEAGSSVIYHGVKVGEILRYSLTNDKQAVSVQIFINDPYTGLIHAGTKFWNASGVQVSVGAGGLKVMARSLQTIFLGGVMFEVPPGVEAGAVANANDKFTLYADQHRAEDSIYDIKVRFLLKPQGSLAGLEPGDDVTMFGQKIGQVDDAHIEFNAAAGKAEALVLIGIEPQRLNFKDLDTKSPDLAAKTTALFQRLAEQKLRASLVANNLLTGDKRIDFDFAEDAEPAKMVTGGAYPEYPMVPADDLTAAIKTLRKTLKSVDKTITSPEVKHAIQELDKTLTNLDGVTKQVDTKIGPLLDRLNRFADTADDTLKKAGSSGGQGGDLAGTLRELKDAARSVRILAEYLEAHPESLLKGKSK